MPAMSSAGLPASAEGQSSRTPSLISPTALPPPRAPGRSCSPAPRRLPSTLHRFLCPGLVCTVSHSSHSRPHCLATGLPLGIPMSVWSSSRPVCPKHALAPHPGPPLQPASPPASEPFLQPSPASHENCLLSNRHLLTTHLEGTTLQTAFLICTSQPASPCTALAFTNVPQIPDASLTPLFHSHLRSIHQEVVDSSSLRHPWEVTLHLLKAAAAARHRPHSRILPRPPKAKESPASFCPAIPAAFPVASLLNLPSFLAYPPKSGF